MNRRKRKIEKMNINNIEKESIKDSVGFVVRIHTGRHASPEIKTQLRSLGLIRKYDGIFMKLDAQTIGIYMSIPNTNLFTNSFYYIFLNCSKIKTN
jgi:hypothetical protein